MGASVCFHTFSLTDRCVRLLVKNLRRHMPEDVVREELESGHQCPGSLAAPIGPPGPGGLQSTPPNPSLYCDGSAGTRSGESALPNRALRFASFGENVRRPERTPAVQALSTLRPYTAVLWLRTPVCCLW